MFLQRCILFACFVTLAIPVSAEPPEIIHDIFNIACRILNRCSEVEQNDAPVLENGHHVSIRFDDAHHCSGSIISKRYILTSHICFRLHGIHDNGKLKRMTIMTGIDSITAQGDEYKVEKVSAPSSDSNIGLVRTTTEIKFHGGIRAIQMADYRSFADDTLLKITAWDYVPLQGVSGKGRLIEYTQKLYNKNKCIKKFEWTKKDNLCTYDPSGNGLCHTDAGGGVVVNGYLIGIHSNDAECFDGGEPKAHTPIFPQLTWISETSGLVYQSPSLSDEERYPCNTTPYSKYSYHAVIRVGKSGEHICSGAILNKRHILTSYLCILSRKEEGLSVTVGVTSLSFVGQTYTISNVIAYDNYDYDFAILRTNADIVFNGYTNPLPILKNKNSLYDNKLVSLVGYERPLFDRATDANLQEYQLQVYNRERCMRTIPFLENRYMCTIGTSSKTVCLLDDGSPIVADGYLIAMKPFGVRCQDGIHLHLPLYEQASWIENNSRV